MSAKQFEVVIKVLKQQQQQQKPKLQPAQAPPQPFDVIPSQHVSLHSPHQASKATCNQSPIASVVITFAISSENSTLNYLDHAGLSYLLQIRVLMIGADMVQEIE